MRKPVLELWHLAQAVQQMGFSKFECITRKPAFSICQQQKGISACQSISSLNSAFVIICLESIIPLVSISERSRASVAEQTESVSEINNAAVNPNKTR